MSRRVGLQLYSRCMSVRSTDDPRDRQCIVDFGETMCRSEDVVGLELVEPLPPGLTGVAIVVGGQVVCEWRVGCPVLGLRAGVDLLLPAVFPPRLRPGRAMYHRFVLQFEYDQGWIEERDGGPLYPETREVAEYSDEWEDFFDGDEIRRGRRVTYRVEPTGRFVRAKLDVDTPRVVLYTEPAEVLSDEHEVDEVVQRIDVFPEYDADYVTKLREQHGLFEKDCKYFVRNKLRYCSNMAGLCYSFN